MKFSGWDKLAWDPYPWVRPLLFRLNPAMACERAMDWFGLDGAFRMTIDSDPALQTQVFGLSFDHPIGLAAGYDRQGARLRRMAGLGFGAIEVGGVPYEALPLLEARALLRRASPAAPQQYAAAAHQDAQTLAQRLTGWRAENPSSSVRLGFNVDGCALAHAPEETAAAFTVVAKLVDYAAVSVATLPAPPPKMRLRAHLGNALEPVLQARQAHAPKLPVLLKVSPDLTQAQQKEVVAVVASHGLQGVIVGVGTSARPSIVPRECADQNGDLSGGPVFSVSTRALWNFYSLTKGKVPLIGVGGVGNAQDAYAKIRAGASLVQLHTALLYEGPFVVRKIRKELAELLKRDGFSTLAQAVGAAHREDAG